MPEDEEDEMEPRELSVFCGCGVEVSKNHYKMFICEAHNLARP